METERLTKRQARRFLLAHQGLLSGCGSAGKEGIVDFIRRVGCIQYDPLNIVGRNAELVLQSRFADFSPELLHQLLYSDRMLLDGLDKVMSIYHREDWPYFKRFRSEALRKYNGVELIADVLPEVRQRLSERGPLSSGDLDFNQTVNWAWAPTRLARAVLESMYLWGELIVHNKKNTRKIYDFAYRHIPAELLAAEDPNITEEEFWDWRVERRIGGVGLLWGRTGDAWIGMAKLKSAERQEAISRLLDQGRLAAVQVEHVREPFYVRTDDLRRIRKERNLDANMPRARILAPLDNLLWDRRLIKELFAFDYKWEVYIPASKRKYGYYVLPILYGDSFAARFEPGFDKESGTLIIKNWWWENGVYSEEALMAELQSCFRQFVRFLGGRSLAIDRRLAEQKGIGSLRF